MSEKGKSKTKVVRFTKSQFLASKQRDGIERDMLSVVLDDNNIYSIAEAEKLIRNYEKRKVR